MTMTPTVVSWPQPLWLRGAIMVLLFPWLSSAQTQTQQIASPRPIFTFELEDAQAECVVQNDAGIVFVTLNQFWQVHDGGYRFNEAWVYALEGNSGEIILSQNVGIDGSNLGACTLLVDDETSLLVINPATAESNLNDGITAVSTDTLQVQWTSNIVRESDKGVPPIVTATGTIVYYSNNGGIAVLDRQGLTQWAATNVRCGQIDLTEDAIYAVDKTPRQGYPLNVYNLETGILRGTTGAVNGATTEGGVVLSPDEEHLYTVRTGLNGGLYRSRADFVFVPADVLTTEVSSAYKFGPLLSPDGNTIYVINPVQVSIEAYSMTESKTLWKSTQCPTIPPILSQDGSALYTFDCSGALVRLDTDTSEIVWRLGSLPTGFTPSFVSLADNDSRLLLSGQVFEERKAYVYSVFTEDAVILPPPTSAPTPSPTMPTTPSPTGPPSPPAPGGTNVEDKNVPKSGAAETVEVAWHYNCLWSFALCWFVAAVIR